ncbi:cytochrome-c oxidase, cbb3-type subunit III [Alkalimarinus sediminis]|uniref:Cbb3-type cytochrome c oxidase subunit n=1 Tax=Alkalimarinus sediminis TaxID=1632866 RepID=A0A9E8KKQ5_9ALTE|nr:cytochrome-c oxidase, cbb3-type subunit III [Alkalimarinus sediminis]UZW76431.1 cytochrome-c oxidase, cbb3-type subunit III [Alkalimarinus sediminis]
MSSFWNAWIIIISLGSIFGCWWLLFATRKGQKSNTETEDTTGHVYDGIEEYDNPLPKWWFYMFLGTIFFGLAYYALYPGLGSYPGLLGWTSTNQWEKEVEEADAKYGPIFAAFAEKSVEELATDEAALKVGQRLYANNCALCHGSTARGSLGFPNLTDNDWLYGGSADAIKHSIALGRNGNMPAKGLNPAMTKSDLTDLTNYLLAFSGRSEDQASSERGAEMFQTACAACHGADAKGMEAMGAPNLTDNIWLYGGTPSMIMQTLEYGRAGVMPAHNELLGEEKVHVLAAYIYSLSQGK